MKKQLFTLLAVLTIVASGKAQCVQTCSNYIVSPTTFSMDPSVGTNLFLQDDELSFPIPIGFTFNFMCSNYSQVLVSSNGFLTFDLNAFDDGCCSGQSIPSAGSTPNNMVAFTWNDLYPPGGGTITYTTIGNAPSQVFILTYSNIPHCCGAVPVNTGQIKLFEGSNSIEIHSALITNDGSTSTQGIEDSTGTIAFPTPGANGSLYTTSNTAYKWSNTIPTPPGAISGPTTVCAGISNNYSVAPMPGASSYSWALPGGWTGTSTTNIIPAVAGASGNLSVAVVYTCGTSAQSTLNVAVPGQTVSISGNTTAICLGSSATLTANGANTYSWNNGAVTSTIIVTPTVNTTYTVIGTSSVTGCSSNAVKTITVDAVTITTTGSGTICAGQTHSLSAGGASTYTWQPGNSTSTVINVAPITTSNYTVTGTSVNGCTNSAVVNVVVSPCTGIMNFSNAAKNISVYPNPNNGEFVIESKDEFNKTIEISDYTGKVVFTVVTAREIINVNLSEMANCIYFVKVQSQNAMEVFKIIKQ